MDAETTNRRVLVVDHRESVHEDVQRILGGSHHDQHARDINRGSRAAGRAIFEVHSACGTREGAFRVVDARGRCEPYALALVGARMVPGCPGIETATWILEADPEIQVVLCMARASDGRKAIFDRFGHHERVVVLNEPLDAFETRLLACSLFDKWRLARKAAQQRERQASQMADARRVMGIIEGCLGELEEAHDELRNHAIELTNRLQQRTIEVAGTRDLAMFALAQLADSRDPETGEHLLRMRAYAQLLAKYLGEQGPYVDQIDQTFLEDFYRSTPLHDIGKVGIPDQILLKPGRLTKEEFEIMKQHTVIGAEALIKASRQNRYGNFLRMASEIARSHHERFDGTGYPDGRQHLEIPLAARITAVADVFDALTSSRIYKDAMPADEARSIIAAEEGRQFDPAVVAAFHACFDRLLEVKESIDSGDQTAPEPLVCFDHPLPLFHSVPLASPA